MAEKEETQDDDALAERRHKLEIAKLELEEAELRQKRIRLLEREKHSNEETKKNNYSSSEQQQGSTRSSSRSCIIELNVGGRVFATSRETLLLQDKSPYFERLLEAADNTGPPPGSTYQVLRGSQRDAAGRIFIDRSPDQFEKILELLRGSRSYEHFNDKQKRILIEEASYYQLDGLIQKLKLYGGGYDPFFLSAEDTDIAEQARNVLESFRNAGDDEELKAAAQIADNLLVDLYDAKGNLTLTPKYGEDHLCCSSPEATLLFCKHALQARKRSKHKLPKTLDEFKSRLQEACGPLFRHDFPFENVVVAGGAVVKALLGDTDGRGDVDLFIVTMDEEAARPTYERILKHVTDRRVRQKAGITHRELLVVRSPFAVTLAVGYPQRNIQIILARHSCAAEIIFNFDIDCCQVVFDGKNVRATPSGWRALETGINIADPQKRTVNYEARLSKYGDRGFLVAVPGLDTRRIQGRYLRDHFYSICSGKLRPIEIEFTEEGPFPPEEGPENIKRPKAIIGTEEIVGLPKLLVFAFRLNERIYYRNRDRRGDIRVKELEGESSFPFTGKRDEGDIYLIDAEKINDEQAGDWERPTPPHPPPLRYVQGFEPFESGSGGGPLIPFRNDCSTPRAVLAILKERLKELHKGGTEPHFTDHKPICCYDFLRNVDRSLQCRRVEDARLQYPTGFPSDEEGHGELKRFLKIPRASQERGSPWVRLEEEGWTSATYVKEE